MGIFNWKYTAADLADWFDAKDEEYWRQHDEWLIDAHKSGEAHPIFVFADWYGDRMSTLVPRINSWLAGGIIDVLRLGNDFDLDSKLGIGKGLALNALRLAQVAGPAAEAVGIGGRWAGLTATSLVDSVAAAGPCRFAAFNNAISFLAGKKTQLFATVQQIDEARALAPTGSMIEMILENPRIAAFMKKAGYTWRDIGNPKTFDEAIELARRSNGPVVVAVDFWKVSGRKNVLSEAAHRLTLVKDKLGRVRILDYSQGKGFQGFGSLEEMWRARPSWVGIQEATMRPTALLFESQKIRLLEMVGNTWEVAIPVAMGLRFGKGASLDEVAYDVARSLWRYFFKTLGDDAPEPPPELEFGKIPDYTKTILVPQKPPYWYTVEPGTPEKDWPSSRAGSAYGEVLLWPLVFEATREEERKNGGIKWRDQNKIFAGQRIFVPDISGYSRQKINAARIRGKDWKRVGP